ncbi:MAG TPA: TlpA disulfide reductase family protein [Thermoguttaceae bacterium]|nr:TlpA disulfide reductase family protein [Thermoguttaceae bacterium]
MGNLEAVDEPGGRPQGTSCLILGVMGIAAVFAGIVIIALAGSILFRPAATGADPARHPAVGSTLPQIELEPLTGTDEPVTAESLAGKVVLVNLWGTWCQPCWQELPHIAGLEGKLRHWPDFKLLAVSCTNQVPEDIDALRQETRLFLAGFELDMPTYADPEGATRVAFLSLGGSGAFPTTLVLDRQGVIRGVWEGFSSKVPEEVERLVLRLLEKQE